MGVCKVIQDGHPDLPTNGATWPFKLGSNDWVALLEGSSLIAPKAHSLKLYKFNDMYCQLVKA
jgi:hypothetical protein